jgi:hypothetical protein
MINLLPVILFSQLASDNISHHSAELTWWQLVSTLHCIQDSLLSQDGFLQFFCFICWDITKPTVNLRLHHLESSWNSAL